MGGSLGRKDRPRRCRQAREGRARPWRPGAPASTVGPTLRPADWLRTHRLPLRLCPEQGRGPRDPRVITGVVSAPGGRPGGPVFSPTCGGHVRNQGVGRWAPPQGPRKGLFLAPLRPWAVPGIPAAAPVCPSTTPLCLCPHTAGLACVSLTAPFWGHPSWDWDPLQPGVTSPSLSYLCKDPFPRQVPFMDTGG